MSDNDLPLKEIIDVAAGRRPAEIVLRGGQIVNVASHEIQQADVAIVGDRIAGIGDYEGRETVDLKGRVVCPGFIDAHVHVESSMLSVPQFARVVAACGTTAVVADPHEFANVMGGEGISFVLRTAKNAPIDVYVMLSSCVPASPLESAGATLTAEDLEPFLNNRWTLGLAEMMNYPGVIAADPDVLAKIEMARDCIVDGHAPQLSGRPLTVYAASGIMSEHECIGADEAAEKLRNGLSIMIREGSQARNLRSLLPLVRPETADRFMFCTDDKDVRHLLDEGQIDWMVRTAIAEGLDPILAVRLAGYSAARYFGLRHAGAVLPGYRADLTILEDLKGCRVTDVYHRGRLVARDGVCVVPEAPDEQRAPLRSSIDVHWIEPDDFLVPAPSGASAERPPKIHVLHVLENRIDTERSIEPAAVRDGAMVADPSRDLAKIVVIERHRASGEIGRGFVRGFALRRGAIASSVAHDAHNIIAVGTNDEDMMQAVVRLVKMRGGLTVADGGKVVAEVPLTVAGLVSDEPAAVVAEKLRRITAAAHDLGCTLAQPFMALSFLSLSVIGKLKVTNHGLIDVERFEVIPLIAG